MSATRTAPLFRPQTLRLLAGSVLLLVYLLAATPLAPVLTALLAAADPNHTVEVAQSSEGVRVVLHHGDINARLHHHGFIAKSLTWMATRASAEQPDHVIGFSGSAVSEQFSTAALKSAVQRMKSECPPVILCHALPVAPSSLLPASHSRPPSGGSTLPPGLRSTVLLI